MKSFFHNVSREVIKIIYLDNAATTKPKPEVIAEIEKILENQWGNPSSLHSIGRDAKGIIDKSRETIANFINAKPNEIVFTSGACESNSMAISGLIKRGYSFITSIIEHSSIMDLAKANKNTTYIPVDKNGYIDKELLELICKSKGNNNLIVSIQYANNEIGTIQNIKAIAEIVHKYNGILHTDVTQMIPNAPIDVKKLLIDTMSFSGQKLGATKGIGVLYIKDGIELEPIIYGTQESKRRGGTENTPYIAGLSKAIETIKYPTSDIRDYFWKNLNDKVDNIYVVGSMDHRLNNNLSVCFKGIEAEALLLILDTEDIYVSSGSACNSNSLESSHVLKAIDMPKADINSVIRFSFGEETSIQDCDIAIEKISSYVNFLRY